VKYVQGKVLGGTSNNGFNVYSRGNPKDYDAWVNATGDDSWSYENLIKFFKKTENYRGKFDDSCECVNLKSIKIIN
jgi:choline dehydrogenase